MTTTLTSVALALLGIVFAAILVALIRNPRAGITRSRRLAIIGWLIITIWLLVVQGVPVAIALLEGVAP